MYITDYVPRIMHQQLWGYKAEEKIYLGYANEKG